MYVVNHPGSIKITAALRRYAKEYTAAAAAGKSFRDFKRSVTVLPAEGDDPEKIPGIMKVIRENLPNRIRAGGKFAKIETVKERVISYNHEIAAHTKVLNECSGVVFGLLDAKMAAKLLREIELPIDLRYIDDNDNGPEDDDDYDDEIL